MKISVAMATYNGEKYILEQLESIRNQTLAVDEVLICDDRSKDNTVAVIKEFISTNKLDNWKIEVNDKNLGYADNFYKAMNLTAGEYIFLCDQDDIWIEDKVEKMVKMMESDNRIAVLGSDFEPFYCTEDAPIISAKTMKTMKYNGELEFVQMNSHNIFIGSEGCTMCVRRCVIDNTREYWYSGWPHDEYLWKMALCMNGMYIYHIKTMKRRLHSNNASKKKMHEIPQRVKFLKNLKESHVHTLQYAQKMNLSQKVIRLLKKNIKSVDMRIDLLENRKILNSIPLAIFYSRNYHSMKSIPVELLMAIRK